MLLLLLGGAVLGSRQVHRPVGWRWLGALLMLALWSSHLSSYVLAPALPPGGGYTWRLAAGYGLPLAALALLATTTSLLDAGGRPERLALGVGAALLLAALLLDPALLWPQPFAPLRVAGARLRQFDVWAGVWGAAWLVPLLTALVVTLQASRRLPPSIYRGQVRYWLLLLLGFLLLTPVALLRDPGRPLWQIIAAAGFLLCATLGTASLTNRGLPDFRFTSRQLLRGLLSWLGGGLLLWGGLQLLRTPGGGRLLDNPAALAGLAAASALLFLLLRRLLDRLTGRFLPPVPAVTDWALPSLDREALAHPRTLGAALVDTLRVQLDVDDIWLARVTPAADASGLQLTPLLDDQPSPARFAAGTPFADFLAHGTRPLVRMDLEMLPPYQTISPAEQQVIHGWQRELLVSVAGSQGGVALLGIGLRRSGESYTGTELRRLQQLADQTAPLLSQASRVAALQEALDAAAASAGTRQQTVTQLEALLTLYRRALALPTPALREPLAAIDAAWARLAHDLPGDMNLDAYDISLPLARLKLSLGALLNANARLAQQTAEPPAAEPIQVGELCQSTLDGLQGMADARRVTLTLDAAPGLPRVAGSPALLQEALQQLVHNAIKFNKIGGDVVVRCAGEGDAVRIDVGDTGVGMTPERLATLGQDLGSLADDDRPVIHLGVALAHYVATAHGGRLEAASTYGAGSNVSLILPAAGGANLNDA